jgi:hypothetical protein
MDLEMGNYKKRKYPSPTSCSPVDPMAVTEPALRRLVQNGTFGDVARGENGSVLSTWLVRHNAQSAMIDQDDPRLRAHAEVCVDKPKSVFAIEVRALNMSGRPDAVCQRLCDEGTSLVSGTGTQLHWRAAPPAGRCT